MCHSFNKINILFSWFSFNFPNLSLLGLIQLWNLASTQSSFSGMSTLTLLFVTNLFIVLWHLFWGLLGYDIMIRLSVGKNGWDVNPRNDEPESFRRDWQIINHKERKKDSGRRQKVFFHFKIWTVDSVELCYENLRFKTGLKYFFHEKLQATVDIYQNQSREVFSRDSYRNFVYCLSICLSSSAWERVASTSPSYSSFFLSPPHNRLVSFPTTVTVY